MPVVNALARELVFKVVYYGPGLGGKTTSLQHIHATTRPENRGKMVSLATPVDRTLYFDFLPIRVPSARDLTVRLQLFTVPGQVYYNATRKLVLTGADGVVFVVDSQRARADANIESLRNLEENLLEHGRGLDELPHVFSYNKRDLPGLVPIDDMERLLNPHGAPSFATVATTGDGVYETLEAITRAVLEDFERRMPEHRGLSPSPLMLPEGGLAEALRGADPGPVQVTHREGTRASSTVAASQELNLSLPPAESSDVGERAARVLAELGASAPDAQLEVALVNPRPKRSSLADRVKVAVPELLPDDSAEAADLPPEVVASPVAAMSEVVATLATGAAATSTRPKQAGGAASAIPGAPRGRESASSSGELEARSQPSGSVDRSASGAIDVAAPGLSLCCLWADPEHSTVARVQDSILARDYRDAILLTDVLVQRCLEGLSEVMGPPRVDPVTLMLLLGLGGQRILRFRSICERSRSTAASPTEQEAKSNLVFATLVSVAATEEVRRLRLNDPSGPL